MYRSSRRGSYLIDREIRNIHKFVNVYSYDPRYQEKVVCSVNIILLFVCFKCGCSLLG